MVTVQYLMHPMEVLKCLKFLPLILKLWAWQTNEACTDEYLPMVTEGAVSGVYKVVTQLSFSVIQ